MIMLFNIQSIEYYNYLIKVYVVDTKNILFMV